MTGIPKDMFLPLSFAVAFAMIASFLASQTFVPILANWMMKNKHIEKHYVKNRSFFYRFRTGYSHKMRKWSGRTLVLFSAYIIFSGLLIFLMMRSLGTDIMPLSNSGDFQMRIDAPQGSRLEKTEKLVKDILKDIEGILPENAVSISSAYVGLHPAATPINPIFLFTNGTHQSVLQVSVNKEIFSGSMEDLKEKIRKKIAEKHPEAQINFEPMELTEKIIGQGSMTPIEIKVGSPNLKLAASHAKKIEEKLKSNDFLRDVRIAEPLQYPTLQINVDRNLAAQFGLTMQDVTRSLVTATSSTRYTDKNLWVDPKSGLVFQTQVQIPESVMNSEEILKSLPLKKDSPRPVLEDIATVKKTTAPAQVNRKGPMRYVTIIGNVYGKDLGSASKAVKNAISETGKPPKSVSVWTEGTLQLLDDTLDSLAMGLLAAVLAIFLMLSAYYQSFKVPFVVLSVIPSVIVGSLVLIFITGSTLNLQSYMGMIMSIGVSVSNAVLLINQAEYYRKHYHISALHSARMAAASRLRPVLMTALAMLAGMIPMAIGIGEGSEQVAPLGRAVIGGIIASTLTILLLVPHFFAAVMSNAGHSNPSLDPEDEESKFFVQS